MKITQVFNNFFESEKVGGLILLVCTITSLLLANSTFGESYHHFWLTEFSGKPLEYWINDGRGIPLTKVCHKCELQKLKQYNPIILKHYNQYDVDEPIEPEEY